MIDASQPIQFDIDIKRFVIRVSKDILDGEEYAALIAIDNNDKEHTFEYRHEGGYWNLAVSSPESGRVEMNRKIKHEE